MPDGKDETGNVEHHQSGAKRNYAFKPKQHFELGEALGMMDFETAAKLSGARFVVLKGGLARMERALGQFMLDVHTGEHGYTEVNPPLLVRDETMFGTAQLPKFENDQFSARPCFDDRRMERYCRTIERGSVLGAGRSRQNEATCSDVQTAERFGARLKNCVNSLSHLWLIPTAEVPLTNLVRESIVDESTLPHAATPPARRASAPKRALPAKTPAA